MNEKHAVDLVAMTELTRKPIIVRIVSILNITSLSMLELFEYGLALKDVNYSMANGVIIYDKPKRPLAIEETSALGIPLTGDYYYSFLNSKVKLTELGLSILESVKSVQGVGIKSPMTPDEQSSDAGLRETSTIS